MSEWLRSLTRNQMGSARTGSNPVRSGWHFYFSPTVFPVLAVIFACFRFLGRGSMFVFSKQQVRRLLGEQAHGRLLDIGAGDGAVTAQMEPLFEEVAVTEISAPMRKILVRRGYRCVMISHESSALKVNTNFKTPMEFPRGGNLKYLWSDKFSISKLSECTIRKERFKVWFSLLFNLPWRHYIAFQNFRTKFLFFSNLFQKTQRQTLL